MNDGVMSIRAVSVCLWFDDDLEEALGSYGRIFGDLHREPDQLDPGTGALLAARFEVAGQRIVGLQGGPGHPHTDAASLYLNIDGGQGELDRLWDGFLAEGATEVACGWLTDRFGISWQIVPDELEAAFRAADPELRSYAFDAMMRMKKIVIADLTPAGA